jgi:hypothetical protein
VSRRSALRLLATHDCILNLAKTCFARLAPRTLLTQFSGFFGRPDSAGPPRPVASTPGTAKHQLSTLLGAYARAAGVGSMNYDRCGFGTKRARKRSLAILLSGDNS